MIPPSEFLPGDAADRIPAPAEFLPDGAANRIPAPIEFLPDGAASLIRVHAAEAEALGRLHPAVLELIYDHQWFRMMVSHRFGGLALPLPQVVRLEEGLSWADGSVGWVVTLCAGAGWFTGFFQQGALDGLVSDRRLCIAGSGMSSGYADRSRDGYRIIGPSNEYQVDGLRDAYRVNGHWAYASGSMHATAFTANCVVREGGVPVLTPEGQPLIRPFLFKKNEVRVGNDWKAVGLVATGSHGFRVDELDLEPERGFMIDAAAAADDDPLYHYPFLPLAEATLAANSSGMAQHFFDCCDTVFADKPPVAGDLLKEARIALASEREQFYAALDHSWASPLSDEFARVSAASHALAGCAVRWVDRLYPYAGLGATHTDREINRVWRDLHTASQHPLLVYQGAWRPSR